MRGERVSRERGEEHWGLKGGRSSPRSPRFAFEGTHRPARRFARRSVRKSPHGPAGRYFPPSFSGLSVAAAQQN